MAAGNTLCVRLASTLILAAGLGPVVLALIGVSGLSLVSLVRADDVEPSYHPSSQVLIFKDDFDDYSTFADMAANGWFGPDGKTTQDYSTNTAGANQIIAPGFDGTGKAARLVYDGKVGYGGGGAEAHVYARNITDKLAAMPGYAFYISFYIRITPGEGLALDQDGKHRLQLKWLGLFNAYGRAQFSTGYQTGALKKGGGDYGLPNGGTGTFWQFLGNSGGNQSARLATQIRPPYAANGAGKWHRLTYKYMSKSAHGSLYIASGASNTGAAANAYSQGAVSAGATSFTIKSSLYSGGTLLGLVNSGDTFTIPREAGAPVHTVSAGGPFQVASGRVTIPFTPAAASGGWPDSAEVRISSLIGSRDGVAQMWYDGTLIVSVGPGYSGVPVPGGAPVGNIIPARWCENEDLDGIYANAGISRIVFASINNGSTIWPFTLDYDHMLMWRDNGGAARGARSSCRPIGTSDVASQE